MAANTLAASYSDLQGVVALALGWHRTPASWLASETADFTRINKEAYRQALYPEPLDGERTGHVWSWLRPKGTLTLNAPYSTGTISSVSTSVTLTGGTWPSWAAAGELWADDVRHTVASRSSDSVIVLDTAPTTAFSADTYELIQHDYDLATDFGGMESNAFTFRRDQDACGEIQIVGEGDLRRADREATTGTPMYASILPVAPANSTTDQKWQATFYPLPSQAWELEYRYVAIPPHLDGSTYVYHYGGAPYSNLFFASYRERAFKLIRDSDEGRGDYLKALRAAVMYDRANNAWHTMGRSANSYGAGKWDLESALRGRRESTVAGITFDSLLT